MRRPMLMIPGPTDSPAEVLRRCGLPAFPHYELDFPNFYIALVAKMKAIFGLERGQVFIANGSGSTAVNMILASLCAPGQSVLVVNNGAFGVWAELNIRSLGARCVSVTAQPGTIVDPDAVRDEMKRGGHRLLYAVHNESSTGVASPLEPLGAIARELDALLLVDAVSAVGGMVIDMDRAGVDAAAGASQKCLELPPGLGLVAIGERTLERLRSRPAWPVPRVLDLAAWQESFETRGDWHPQPMTGATTLMYALDWMADRILEEGLFNRQERFRAAGDHLKAGLRALGFQTPADSHHASPVLTEFLLPGECPAADLRAYYLNVHNTMVGRGERTNAQGVPISFRIAHFGQSAARERIDFMIRVTHAFMNRSPSTGVLE